MSEAREKILLVEDEAIIAMSEAATVEQHGFQVLQAHSAAQAIQTVDENPDLSLVLMDIDLGRGMDGTQAAQEILKAHDLPIVFLTSHAEEAYVDRVKKITGYGYVLKSSGDFVLMESIRTALERFRADKALQKERTRLWDILAAMDMGMIVHDPGYRVAWVNPKIQKMFPGPDPVGTLCYERFEALSRPCEDCAVKRSFETGKVSTVLSHNHADGRWFKSVAQPVVDSSGRTVQVLETVEDVTEDQRVAEKLRESETFRERLLNSLVSGVYVHDLEKGCNSFMTRQYTTLTGWALDDVSQMGTNFTRLFHPADLPRVRAHFQAIAHAEDNEVLEVEYRFRKKDGDWIWCVSRDTVFERNERGEVRRFIGSFFDITERKRAELALRESEQRLHSILQNLPVPIIVSEGEFQQVLSLNRKFVEVFGYTLEEVPDVWHWWPKAYPDEVSRTKIIAEWTRKLRKARAHGSDIEPMEVSITCKDGSCRRVVVMAYVSGSLNLVVFYDMTELHRARLELEQSLQEKDGLMQELNHRVKNNLYMVSSLINMKNRDLGDTVDLSDIKRQIDAIGIVHERLQKTNSVTQIDVGAYIRELLDGVFSSLRRRRVRLDIRADRLPLNTKYALPIGLIVNELATNAVKHGFHEDEEAVFMVTLQREPAAGPRPGAAGVYRLVVSNSGRPFPENVALEHPKTLGLRLVSALASQLGGGVELERHPVPCFTIRFPIEG